MEGIILGCGPSGGVPSVRWGFGACDPNNRKNFRTRSSFFFRTKDGAWLIDASPDLRGQCLAEDIHHVDGVLCTHAHFDHVGGVGDLVSFAVQGPLPVYANDAIADTLETIFPYACLGASRFVQVTRIKNHFRLGKNSVTAFIQSHGKTHSLGYRFKNWAYSTDVVELSEQAFDVLQGIETWILACLSTHPNPKHAHLDLVLSWIDRVRPQRTILTHMNTDLDYEVLKKRLPPHIEPGYDGMRILL